MPWANLVFSFTGQRRNCDILQNINEQFNENKMNENNLNNIDLTKLGLSKNGATSNPYFQGTAVFRFPVSILL